MENQKWLQRINLIHSKYGKIYMILPLLQLLTSSWSTDKVLQFYGYDFQDNQDYFFCLHRTSCSSCDLKSRENHPWTSRPFTWYVEPLSGKFSAIFDELSSLKLPWQKPTPSLENWMSQNRTKSHKLLPIAMLYASWLDSGSNPENPPRAMTRGRRPVGQY
jgi:hypothetical protein